MSIAKARILIALSVATLFIAGCSLPIVSEREIAIEADQQFNSMRSQTEVSTDWEVRSYVICVAQKIIDELDEPYASMNWDIEIFDNEAVNAFAMPGGNIGVFTGILRVAENQDQLGAVLGHEVAHVTEQHSVERANREITTQVGTTAVGAIFGGGYGDMARMGAQLGLSLPYGRRQESEADVVGLAYMADAGFDPRASVKLWKNMAANNQSSQPEFLSTHPSSDTRIDDLIGDLPSALAKYNAAEAAGKNPQCGPP
jgi:predicted Zn-dependent protease